MQQLKLKPSNMTIRQSADLLPPGSSGITYASAASSIISISARPKFLADRPLSEMVSLQDAKAFDPAEPTSRSIQDQPNEATRRLIEEVFRIYAHDTTAQCFDISCKVTIVRESGDADATPLTAFTRTHSKREQPKRENREPKPELDVGAQVLGSHHLP